jgi:hypothetical protein
MVDVETGVKLGEEGSRQVLSEDIGELRSHEHLHTANIPNVDLVMDEVEINIDMICVLMLNRVGCQVDCTDIVAIDKSVVGQRGVKHHE